MSGEQEAYEALCAYTLSHRDPAFIHQHVVDAFIAERADENTKPLGLTFALAGLYLLVEKGWTGRQVQRAHMLMARRKREWPRFDLPPGRGSVTVIDVMEKAEGAERDAAIHEWCRSLWEACSGARSTVVQLLREYGIV